MLRSRRKQIFHNFRPPASDFRLPTSVFWVESKLLKPDPKEGEWYGGSAVGKGGSYP